MAAPVRIRKMMPQKGLRSSWPADDIGQDNTPNCVNVRMKFGEVRQGPGRTLFDGSPINEPVQQYANYSRSNDVIWPIMMTNTKLYSRGVASPGDFQVWNPLTGTFTITGTRRWGFCNGEDSFFFCKGNERIGYWDGSGNYDLIENVAGFEGYGAGTEAPVARYLEYFNNRVIAADTVEGGIRFANRLRWPQSGDFRKWDETLGLGAGFLDLNDEGAERIQQIKALGDRLVIYRPHSITEMIATGTLTPVHITRTQVRGLGLLGNYTVASSGSEHFFLGTDKNVWSWNGTGITPIGAPIQEELKGLVYLDAVDKYIGVCLPSIFEYWLILADIGRQSYNVFIYDYLRKTWTRDSFPDLHTAAEVEIPLQVYIWSTIPGIWTDYAAVTWNDLFADRVMAVLGGRTDGGSMRIDETVSYDYYTEGSIIDRYLETEDMYFDTPWMLNQVVRLMLVYEYVNSDPFEVGISFDRGRSWEVRQIAPVMQGYSFIEFARTGNVTRFRFRENNADGKFRWRSYMLETIPEGEFIGTTTA